MPSWMLFASLYLLIVASIAFMIGAEEGEDAFRGHPGRLAFMIVFSFGWPLVAIVGVGVLMPFSVGSWAGKRQRRNISKPTAA